MVLSQSLGYLWPRTSTGSELFEIFGRYFENNIGQIVFTTVTTFSDTNLVALRHIKREKPAPPADVRRSKLNRVKTLKSPKRALVKMVQYHKFWTIAKKVSNWRRLICTCSRSLVREVGAVIVVPFLVSMSASSAKSVAVCSVEKKKIYNVYSFKIFPRFWLAKSTRTIHHNQLLMTKFGRMLCLTRKWRQKFLQVNEPLTEKTWGWGWVVLVVTTKNGGHFTRFKSKN